MAREKLNEKNVPYGARKKMPLWYGAVWSTRGISAGLNVVLAMQIAFYCTDIIGLDATIVGTLFMVSKIVDAFTDLGFGYILDKTHTRWGKARPYEVFIIFEWLFTVLMFNIPNASPAIQYAWLFIMYTMINAVCATALGGIDSVYMARAFTTEGNQIKAMSINGFLVMFASIVFNIVFPSFLAGAGTTKAGWSQLVLSMGVILAIFGILRFIFCKEIVVDESADGKKMASTNSLTLKESLGLLGQNKYLFIVVALMLLTFVVNNMSTATTYYFKYIVGDLEKQGLAAVTSMVVVPALIFFPILSQKLGTTKILQCCCVIGVVGLVIRTIGGTNMTTIIVGGLLAGIGTLPISMMINTYLIDCMDYGEWKTGVRIEGLVASIANFASKVGNGIAVGLVGLVMGLAGYDGLAAAQTPATNGAIIFLYNILPVILFVVMFILSLMYKVDKIRPQMEADLEKLHSGKKQ